MGHDILTSGTNVGSYRIERLLGRGGAGTVYLAYDTTLHRQVALKMITAPAEGETSRARLQREARNAAALNHPNICTVYEVGDANDFAFIAMEYVAGRSLRDRIDAGALPVDEAVRYGLHTADALAYAHEHGVVHRDFKAANAIVGDDGRLKVVDFGLARRDDARLAEATTFASVVPAGAVAGTPYAMAPEQVRGQAADARTDIWALGVLLYEMVTGARPFESATTADLFSSILRDAPAPMPDTVPIELRAVVERCLEKAPERRYQHASEVRAALEVIQASTVATWSPWRSRLARRRSLCGCRVARGHDRGPAGVQHRRAARLARRGSRSDGPRHARGAAARESDGGSGAGYLSDGLTDQVIAVFSRLQLSAAQRDRAHQVDAVQAQRQVAGSDRPRAQCQHRSERFRRTFGRPCAGVRRADPDIERAPTLGRDLRTHRERSLHARTRNIKLGVQRSRDSIERTGKDRSCSQTTR